MARREAPTTPTPGAAEIAATLVMANAPLEVKQEQGLDPGLEDMPELEEEPPAPFPSQWASAPAKKCRKEDQD